MYEIKEIKIWPLARGLALFGFIFSIIAIVIFFLLMILAGEIDIDEIFLFVFKETEALAVMLGIILAATAGFGVVGALSALIYNYLSQKIGGIKLDIGYLEDENKK